MKRERIATSLLAAVALLAAMTCRTTRTVVAKVVTPTPMPAGTPVAPPPPPLQPPVIVTAMPVVTTAPVSIYDRTPGILYEQGLTPSAPPPRPAAAQADVAEPTVTITPTRRPRPTPPPSETPAPTRTPAPSTTATPTHKPGAYYEDSDFRPAVTWTPTPDRRH